MEWRDENGILEMILTYIGQFHKFTGWEDWKNIVIDILTCHEKSRRQSPGGPADMSEDGIAAREVNGSRSGKEPSSFGGEGMGVAAADPDAAMLLPIKAEADRDVAATDGGDAVQCQVKTEADPNVSWADAGDTVQHQVKTKADPNVGPADVVLRPPKTETDEKVAALPVEGDLEDEDDIQEIIDIEDDDEDEAAEPEEILEYPDGMDSARDEAGRGPSIATVASDGHSESAVMRAKAVEAATKRPVARCLSAVETQLRPAKVPRRHSADGDVTRDFFIFDKVNGKRHRCSLKLPSPMLIGDVRAAVAVLVGCCERQVRVIQRLAVAPWGGVVAWVCDDQDQPWKPTVMGDSVGRVCSFRETDRKMRWELSTKYNMHPFLMMPGRRSVLTVEKR